ncbi:sugar ABC transporter substrate-binding protein [Paenibacillus sp. J31TS4]|uniref:extracellular solute-binding protein n=1 Tax=Paenibacillus sp. J31TS4 TaxID=2807195 RepID=UPI001B024AD7|nr:extracellular solute-binding protein [Paenibacillus sp. J31TS4]GIP40103.1 sugar ABC transporter substrate-binding protein [Paenibacillus sp. J31TS4]
MKNRWKSSARAGTTLVLAGSLLAACGGQDNPPAASGTGGGTNEPVTLSMMIATHNSWPYKEDWGIFKWYKEKTNVEFKIEAPPNDYTTAVNLAISSGSLPDLMNVTGLTTANKYGNAGAFVNILDHLDKLPNYKKFLDQHPEVKETVLSADGKSYLFPVYGLDKQSRRSWIYREDIFAKHGLKPPTTYDELYTVAKKLKELYPDSFPIGIFDNLGPLNNMTYGFGTANTTYYDFDKKEWRYGPIEDTYKELVTYMNKFYKEGLVPPDFMALKRKQWQDLFTQNKAFIGNDYIGSIDEIVSDNKDFNLNFMIPPKGGPSGVAKNLNNGFITTGFAISSNSKKQDAAFRFMDFLYSPEGIEIASWGKEGETYTVENGKKKFKPEIGDFTKMRQKYGFATYGTYAVLDMEGFFSTFSPKMQAALKDFDKYEAKMQPRVAYTDAENEQLSTLNDSISKYKEEQVAKFILGQRPLSEWDAYVAEFKKLGVQKVLDINKTAYERTLKYVQQK